MVLSEINLILLQIFEVATNTRIKDLILNISRKLELSSADGFSIFVKTNDKVHSVFLYIYTIDGLACLMNKNQPVVVFFYSVSVSQFE